MFLFDKSRSGRIPYTGSVSKEPETEFVTEFKQLLKKCPESSPVIDSLGNIYFGNHDGSFYCLNSKGQIQWQFVTDDKIYSSPLLIEDKLFFCCNQSEIVCIDLAGNFLWSFNGYKEKFKSSNRWVRLLKNLYSHCIYDYELKQYMKINAWSSPNLLGEDSIIANLYGTGIVALNYYTGNLLWKYDLGTPINHLSGVAIGNVNENEIVFAAGQSTGLFALDKSGELLWKRRNHFWGNAWANPSFDEKEKCVYYSESNRNKWSVLYKYSWEGHLIWKKKFNCGVRGSATIGKSNIIVLPTLDGKINILNKETGHTIHSMKIASTDRGLWTSASLSSDDSILINTKNNSVSGSLICLSPKCEILWKIDYGKALSVPVVDSNGFLYTGTWDGKFYKLKFNQE